MSNNSSAESLREKGNEFYKKKDYDHAIDCYSQSIAIQGTAAAYDLCLIALFYLDIQIVLYVTSNFKTTLKQKQMHLKQLHVMHYL